MKILAAVLTLIALTGCTSVHHVSPKQFQLAVGMHSLHWSEYIGQADGKVYLLRKSAPLIGKNWTEEILFTEAVGLSPEFLNQLQKNKEQKASNQ